MCGGVAYKPCKLYILQLAHAEEGRALIIIKEICEIV